MDGRDRGKRKAKAGETSNQGGGAKKERGSDTVAVVKSTDALKVGARWGSTDDVSATLGGDGASSVDTSLTLDIGATATRVWYRNSRVGQQVSDKSECASNSDGAVDALSDGHNVPAVEGSVPVVDAAPSTGSSRNDPVNDGERCPACLVRMGLPEDHPTYHICLCVVCLARAALCPICGVRDQTGSP